MPFSQTTSHGKLAALIREDPKKACILAALVLLLGGMWVKMALSGGPKTAGAMPVVTNTPTASPETNNPPRSTDCATLLRDWEAEPLPQSVSHNIFELKLDYYPMDATRVVPDSRTSDDPTFWDRLAKSIDAQAEEHHKRETLIQNLRQQANQLQLTSTVMGPRPKAMVNGAMVGEGEVVAQFRVLKIEARSVVVEREGIRLEIPMK